MYTSEASTAYNCFAYAAGDVTRKWSPWEDYHWPDNAPRSTSVSAFVVLYETLGYVLCEDGDYEEGFEKIAIYADPFNEATHAARQIGPNAWTSKLGDMDDITHTLNGLVSREYGSVSRFLKRPKP